MPFKSKAQRRKFAEMMVKGEISPETFEEWNRETGSAELPERVSPKRPAKKAARSTRTSKTKAARKKVAGKSKAKSARRPKGNSARRSPRKRS